MTTASTPPADTILDTAMANFEDACSLFDDSTCDAAILEKLRHPLERTEFTFSLALADRQLHHFWAFIVQHNDALGPAKGGLRSTPAVSLEDTTGLAMEMTWKCALVGVPFGGGKSAIVADPASLSAFDKEAIIRGFSRAAARHIDPLLYVPAPDMGTTERDMGHLKDAIASCQGYARTRGCYVTGKPVLLGGIPGRRQATGSGVAHCVGAAADTLKMDLNQMTAVVQGLGKVGLATVQTLTSLGIQVIGVADVNETRYAKDGFDAADLAGYIEEYSTLLGYHDGEAIEPEELFQLPCDVLVPAATSGQITEANAESIQAPLVAEAANGPTTPAAARILEDRGVLVIPDILCNAGGVFVSYLEYSQETQQEQMTEQEVTRRLSERMRHTFTKVHEMAQQKGWPMRDAAMYLAIKTVAEATIARGHLL